MAQWGSKWYTVKVPSVDCVVTLTGAALKDAKAREAAKQQREHDAFWNKHSIDGKGANHVSR